MALIKNSMSSTIARDALVLDLADVRVQAQLIVEQARKQAEGIVAAARAEREKLIAGAAEQGRKDGFAKGQAEGHAAGIKQGAEAGVKEQRAKLDELQKAWKAALDMFVASRESLLLDARTNIMRVAMCIAERVVKRRLAAQPDLVVDQLNAALGLTLGSSRLKVTVNPDDAPLIQAALPQIQAAMRDAAHIDIAPDPAVARGGCRVVTDQPRHDEQAGWTSVTRINAEIDVQLNRIAEALVPGLSQAEA